MFFLSKEYKNIVHILPVKHWFEFLWSFIYSFYPAVFIDKIVYTNGIKKVLVNLRQFEKLSIDPNKELNFTLNCEQKVTDILKVKIKIRLTKTHTINYAHLVVNLESFMVLQKSIKWFLMAALLFNQFFQPLGHPCIR